jgi:2-C-methyl-D-erythritol 4-phosphate cytidylyltransferase
VKNKNYALILAGGEGLRFASYSVNALPKQFAKIGDKSILEMSISAFERCSTIDRIVVVMNPKYLDQARELIDAGGYKKVVDIIRGGATRFDSSFAGLKRVLKGHERSSDTIKVLIHDAVRPYVAPKIIADVLRELGDSDGVQPLIPLTQTIVERTPSGWVSRDRDNFALVQTPQGFWLDKIIAAYRTVQSSFKNWVATDDISVLQKANPDAKISIVEGDSENRKITFPADLPK